MKLFTTIAFFAAAQGVFLCLVLFFLKRGNRSANTYLALLTLAFSLWIAEFAAYFTEHLYDFPHLLFATAGLPLLFGPLLLFYTQSLNGEKALNHQWDILHFLPFLLYILYHGPFYLESAAFKIENLKALQNMNNPPEFSYAFFTNESLKFLQLAIYLLVVMKCYKKWKNASQNDLQTYQLNWIKHLVLGLSLFALFDLSHLLELFLFQYDYLFGLAQVMLLSGAVVVYFIGYTTLKQPELIAGHLKIIEKEAIKKPVIRYKKSSFDGEKAEVYIRQLLQKMEEEKLYLNEDLKLKTLAQSLDLSTHHLSQLLNEHLQKNYFDFVNEYRVKTAQDMLKNPDLSHFTILSIAFDSGFKNKATFNTAFKKHTGTTPSKYKKQFLLSEN